MANKQGKIWMTASGSDEKSVSLTERVKLAYTLANLVVERIKNERLETIS